MPHSTEKLRRFVEYRPDCSYHIGVPLGERPQTWEAAAVRGGRLWLASGAPVALESVRAYAIVYANGEIMDAQLRRLGLPAGARYLDPTGPSDGRRITLAMLAAGQAVVEVAHERSPIHDDDPHYYQSRLHNRSDAPVEIAGFTPAHPVLAGGAVVAFQTGRRYDRDQFAAWYRAPGARITAGATVRDLANWSEGPCTWIYDVVCADGRTVITGATSS